jgi:serine/threonine protein kinase
MGSSMNESERFQRLEALFHELDALDPLARASRLASLADSAPELHAELRAMFPDTGEITARARALDALGEASRGSARGAEDPTEIGPYTLLERLGEGGMGRVYRAEQSQPVQRSVALKLMRRGLDGSDAVARFLAERQALAVLDHPHIARVFDAGSTADGRPWFAMEYIEGEPITRWASQRGLGLEERIRLLLPVCEAVQHAHRKGLIHRDLKPSNILVMNEGGRGFAKVIDFGIARLIDPAGDGRSQVTQLGELIGTPEYMSPEQAALGAIDIDTRSDVYSLGLVLYELLVGALPLSGRRLRALGFEAMCREIREGDTPRPSRFRAEADGADPVTARWRARLRGDLDSVLLKALAKDREQRYGSASELADDLKRYLDNQPVRAQPPSLRYRAGKFIRRHRWPVAMAASLTLALIVGVAAASYGLVEARRAQAQALAAAEQAEQSKQVAERTAQFMVGLFQASDPRENPGLNLDARTLLERGEQRVQTFEGAPAVKARLLESLGDVYFALGAFDRAEPLLLQGIELLRATAPVDAQRLASLLDRQAGLLRDRGDNGAAETLLREALQVMETAGLNRDVGYGRSLNSLGILLSRSGRLDEAAETLQRSIDLTLALPALDAEAGKVALARLPNARANLAGVLHRKGDYLGARAATEAALAQALQDLPENHPFVGGMYNNLARASEQLGDLGRALVEARRTVRIDRELYAEDHPNLAQSLLLEAQVLARLGKPLEATAGLREAERMLAATAGRDSPAARMARQVLAQQLARAAAPEEALSLFAGLIASAQPAQPSETRPDWLAMLRWAALAERRSGRPEAAAALLQRGLDAVRAAAAASLAGEHAQLLLALALVEQAQGERGAAQQTFEQAQTLAGCDARALCERLDDPRKGQTRAAWLAQQGEPALALDLLEATLESRFWQADLLSTPDVAVLAAEPRWQPLQARLQQRLQSALQEAGGP